MRAGVIPVEVTTDRAPAYPRVMDELIPSSCTPWSDTPTTQSRQITGGSKPGSGQCAGEAATLSADSRRGHAFVQNLRRGHYDIATHVSARHQLRTAFDELAVTI